MQTRTVEVKNGVTSRENNNTNRNHGARNKSGVNKGLKRYPEITKKTPKKKFNYSIFHVTSSNKSNYIIMIPFFYFGWVCVA